MINYLPNNKILDWSKLKELADDKINVTEKVKFGFGHIDNIVGKVEMLVTSIFSFSRNISKGFFHRVFKSGDCVVKRVSWNPRFSSMVHISCEGVGSLAAFCCIL